MAVSAAQVNAGTQKNARTWRGSPRLLCMGGNAARSRGGSEGNRGSAGVCQGQKKLRGRRQCGSTTSRAGMHRRVERSCNKHRCTQSVNDARNSGPKQKKERKKLQWPAIQNSHDRNWEHRLKRWACKFVHTTAQICGQKTCATKPLRFDALKDYSSIFLVTRFFVTP